MLKIFSFSCCKLFCDKNKFKNINHILMSSFIRQEYRKCNTVLIRKPNVHLKTAVMLPSCHKYYYLFSTIKSIQTMDAPSFSTWGKGEGGGGGGGGGGERRGKEEGAPFIRR